MVGLEMRRPGPYKNSQEGRPCKKKKIVLSPRPPVDTRRHPSSPIGFWLASVELYELTKTSPSRNDLTTLFLLTPLPP